MPHSVRRAQRRRLVASVRFRVTALAALATLLVLVVTSIVLVAAQERLLIENLEESLDQGIDNIETALVDGGVPDVLGGFGDDDSLAQVVDEDGEVVAATPNIAGEPPIAPPPTGDRSEVRRTTDGLPVDDSEFRVVSRRVDGADGPAVVHVAATLGDIADSTGILVTSLVVAVPVVVALLAAVVWWLVGRTLRPVEAIRAEVAGIGGSDLHRRVPEPPTGDEINRLAVTMNAMLDRVEDTTVRHQRFVADASHELRSPLTRMRSELEVDLAHPTGADLIATHRSVLEEAAGLQQLVDDLLHLARNDAVTDAQRRQPVDLDDVVLDHARRLRDAGGLAVDTSQVSAVQVEGDQRQLSRAVGNLVDNAVRHAATTVSLALGQRGSVAELTVSDDGPGIPPEQREVIFDRFARLDEARTSSAGGTGLGLAIVRDVVERHGGTVRVDPGHRPGARFVVTLPVGPPAD